MRYRKYYAVLAAAGLVLSGCCQAYAAKTDNASREFFAMDTVMSVSVYGEDTEEAVDEAVALVNRLDAELSTGNEKSEVSRINSAGRGTLSDDGSFLMKKALSLYEDTGGLSSVTVITSDGTMADGLSTFLYIAGEEKAAEYWHKYETAFDMILVRDDGSILVTEGAAENFSTDRDCRIIYKGD